MLPVFGPRYNPIEIVARGHWISTAHMIDDDTLQAIVATIDAIGTTKRVSTRVEYQGPSMDVFKRQAHKTQTNYIYIGGTCEQRSLFSRIFDYTTEGEGDIYGEGWNMRKLMINPVYGFVVCKAKVPGQIYRTALFGLSPLGTLTSVRCVLANRKIISEQDNVMYVGYARRTGNGYTPCIERVITGWEDENA